MPELPEVETVRLGLNQVTSGQEILGGDVLRPRTIAHPVSAGDFLAGLQGATVAQWHRRGKYLLAELCRPGSSREGSAVSGEPLPDIGTGGWLGVHLRMTGQLLWLDRDTPLQKHTRVRLFFPGNRELRFVDQRTFGQMWLLSGAADPSATISGLGQLGPEPLCAEFSPEYLAKALGHRRRPVKTALLDQSVVAGAGNIYADEALFVAGVRPDALCANLSREQIAKLRDALIEVLQEAIIAGGSTIRNFVSVEGVNGNYAGVARVYGRAGQPCRVCGTPVERLKLAGRSSHFCRQCQK
ncbi:DNA-formamidopyrimidine glycosylase [Kamptonema formosum]|uniref:DNA-formamidopyrimidine glycosylase n=1 Tax=Kamptonema formosum TaxID=331992 RepID=UPI00034612EB|nr:DNA-formamidopyrimidine glycosylase [Oscillatoria sp. PCC 10802]